MISKTTIQRWLRNAVSAAAVLMALAAPVPCVAASKLDVVVTIKPIHALVAQVMAGLGEPRLLVTGQASPHSFSLRPSDARALQQADVFFRVSESVEPFTQRLVAALPESVRTVTLADSDGIRHLERRTGGTFEAHAHGGASFPGEGEASEDAVSEETHHEGEDHEGQGADGHDGHRWDGHVWLDPENAKAMVEAIVRVLVEISPENAERLKANAFGALARLDGLATEIETELRPIAGKPFAVFHDAYQYFERRFGLSAVGAITVSPEVQPSAKRLSELRARIAGLGAVCVFAEPSFSPNVVTAVIEGTAAKAGQLDPEGLLVAPGPDAYDALLRGLAKGLRDCLM